MKIQNTSKMISMPVADLFNLMHRLYENSHLLTDNKKACDWIVNEISDIISKMPDDVNSTPEITQITAEYFTNDSSLRIHNVTEFKQFLKIAIDHGWKTKGFVLEDENEEDIREKMLEEVEKFFTVENEFGYKKCNLNVLVSDTEEGKAFYLYSTVIKK